jgi:hypothetical protein
MTPRTRRRLTVCLVLGLLTLPAEALLFPVALTPDPRVAADEWVGGLSHDDVVAATANIDHYPGLYRRALMGALDPAERSGVWRQQFEKYLSSHPSLSTEQIAFVRDAIDAASPAAFTLPLDQALKDRIGKIFGQATKVLGPKDAGELFVTLGPKAVTNHNALPFTQQIADQLRSWRSASASQPDCNCNIEMDTCDLVPDPWLQCSELYSCNFDLHWPMCGPFWSWACTGWCKIIRWPEID